MNASATRHFLSIDSAAVAVVVAVAVFAVAIAAVDSKVHIDFGFMLSRSRIIVDDSFGCRC